MARSHGRNAQIYVGATQGAAASPIAYMASWTMNMVTDKQDVTAFGDPVHVYVAGLPDASGDFAGFADDATSQTYKAATDGLPRSFYLYPNISAQPNVYFFGTVIADISFDGAIGGPINVKSSWNAGSQIQRYTPFGGLNS
jgi:hypothetical protein